ncbi:proline-rich protein [Laccaria bicolor S238N-H82]|uniref:Proline-rich protein n=1 Tax=Laccaria bicolor (strain S238N-H82 / ATCC MYA-4686) TaxID=486041 RepID=B0D7T9_LACBS|nr:proline-rich protein [Laccaria bicolor S238N-H82]EDR09705.1 proline-rich protein [Laccaria bicolor S238N-H82]|eukprot:XP_001880054.1 proline-rich protein [Laccaria bicolor S238N-H82]
MPSFADLKAKAASATSSGVEKLQNVRDRNTSVPMKKTNWDPYSGNPPPPPPPPRINQKSRPAELAPLPPPPSRTGSIIPPSISSSRSTGSTAPPLPSRGPVSSPPLPPRGPVSSPPLPPRGPASTPPLPPRGSSAAPSPSPVPPTRNFVPTAPSAAGPPPIVRATRPPIIGFSISQEPTIDWTNISAQDKETFFAWLDEYFSKLLGIQVPSNTNSSVGHPSPFRGPTKPASWRPSFGGM